MKKCLVCGWEGEPAEWTCPMCGEASWSESAPAVPPAPAKSDDAKPSKKAKN